MKKYYLLAVLLMGCFLLAHAQDYIKPMEGELVVGDIIAARGNTIEFKLVDEKDTTVYFMKKDQIQSIGFYPSYTKELTGVSKGSELIKSQSVALKDYLILKDETIAASTIDSIRNENIYFHLERDTTSYFVAKKNITAIVFSSTPVTYTKGQPSKKGSLSAGEMYKKGIADAQKYYKGYQPAAVASFLVSWTFYGLAVPIAASLSTPKEENLNYPDAELMQDGLYAAGYTQTAKRIKSRKVWTGAALSYVALLGIVIVTTTATAH